MKAFSIYIFVAALSLGTYSWTMKKSVVNQAFIERCVRKTLEGMPEKASIEDWSLPFPMSFLGKELKGAFSSGELKFLENKQKTLMDEFQRTKNQNYVQACLSTFARFKKSDVQLPYSIFRSEARSMEDILKVFTHETNSPTGFVSACVRSKMLLWYNEWYLDSSTQQKKWDEFNKYRNHQYLEEEVFGPLIGKPVYEVVRHASTRFTTFFEEKQPRLVRKFELINMIATVAVANQLAPGQGKKTEG